MFWAATPALMVIRCCGTDEPIGIVAGGAGAIYRGKMAWKEQRSHQFLLTAPDKAMPALTIKARYLYVRAGYQIMEFALLEQFVLVNIINSDTFVYSEYHLLGCAAAAKRMQRRSNSGC